MRTCSERFLQTEDRDTDSVISDYMGGTPSDLGNDDDGQNSLEPIAVARKETKGVNRLKGAVGMVLASSAVMLASLVYVLLSHGERDQFHKQFKGDSHKVLEAVGSSIDKTLGLLDSVAISFLSSARDKNQTWPFVTMPDFAVKMTKILPITDAFVISMLPVVTAAQRKDWEAYSLANNGWVNEGVAVQEKWTSGYYGPVIYDGIPDGVIHSSFADLPYNLTRDYLPLWQNFPVIPNTSFTLNWDWMSVEYPDSFPRSIDNQKAVMAEAYMLPDPGMPVREAETQAWAEYFAEYIGPNEEPIEPMSDLIYPILDGVIEQAKVNVSDLPSDRTAVGIIAATLYWRDLIRNILPDSSGLDVVFSICDANFTYRIKGANVEYRGLGDVHDAGYDDLRISSRREFAIRNPLYTGVPLDTDYCFYELHLYPMNAMRSSLTTVTPIVSACFVLFIFMFTSLVFYLYDKKVESRQYSVMKTAVRSSQIVSSLFPSTVRDRLYPESGDAKHENESSESSDGGDFSPIASLYLETTVLFADIAGFTAWSSERSPAQVFLLLETLYGAFDSIAKKRGVFKVETIGDCYVAVVGLPTPRKNHALVMARFARDCIVKMSQLIKELEPTLGAGTLDLALRVGLNSGQTMAGVLRGEKSRFQLFGDTVNTAARMESNGESNRIHVSAKTAELVREGGKSHWLTPRKGKVSCKGKGMMATYWCDLRRAGREDSHVEPVALDALIDWKVEALEDLLKCVVFQRDQVNLSASATSRQCYRDSSTNASDDIHISAAVSNQLREFVSSIAKMHRIDNFRIFERCCHVTLSTRKLLDAMVGHAFENSDGAGDTLFDPHTQLAMYFAILIRGLAHPGVSGAWIVSETSAASNDTRAVPEDLILKLWDLLMQDQFTELRSLLFTTSEEQTEFHQAVTNAVAAGNAHWGPELELHSVTASSRQGSHTAKLNELDLIMRVADASHAMQHFSIFKKWSTLRLSELYADFACARITNDPTEEWYESELMFFDEYVIPLARELQACNVFGATGTDWMNYALENRIEWEMRGRDIVEESRFDVSA